MKLMNMQKFSELSENILSLTEYTEVVLKNPKKRKKINTIPIGCWPSTIATLKFG